MSGTNLAYLLTQLCLSCYASSTETAHGFYYLRASKIGNTLSQYWMRRERIIWVYLPATNTSFFPRVSVYARTECPVLSFYDPKPVFLFTRYGMSGTDPAVSAYAGSGLLCTLYYHVGPFITTSTERAYGATDMLRFFAEHVWGLVRYLPTGPYAMPGTE
eukprot:1310991-Rhodomonas_salina.3